MCAPRIEDLVRIILNAFELSDALLGLFAFGRIDLSGIEFRLQFFLESRRFFLRLEAGTIDGPMTGLTSIDARHRHVVHVDVEIGKNDLIDLERRRDEVEHRRIEEKKVSTRRDRGDLFVDQINRRSEFFPLVFRVFDALEPDIDVRLSGVATARDVLQTKKEVGEMLRLLLVRLLLRGGVGAFLHDGRFRFVALRVEIRFGEAIVLIGRVVLPFDRVEIFLRDDVLRAMLRDHQFLIANLLVEIGELLFVLRLLRGAKVLLETIVLQAQELPLEPLPSAHVVVHHDRAGGTEEKQRRQGEDEIQLRHAVVVRNRLLRFHDRPSPAASRHPLPAARDEGKQVMFPFSPRAGRRWPKAG